MTYRRMKPCPNCASEVSRYKYESGWIRIECDNPACNYIAMPAGNVQQAIENHNTVQSAAPDAKRQAS